jgi:phosphoribosylaminoimidazolecarboxamide formyltransferase/IMP cyclohydrolase
MNAFQFAMSVVKHVRSNAIVIANCSQTISIAGGFTNRVDAVEQALNKAKLSLKDAVLASDAFFPFPDSIELIKNSGIQYIVQPGGSVQDIEVAKACDKYGLCMIFTGNRHFKH